MAQASGAAGPKDARVYEPATYALSFLWLEKNIAVAVDQVFGKVRDWGFMHEPCNIVYILCGRWMGKHVCGR
jgi:hypothetical protein